MEKEVWSDVPHFEDLYQVSNLGNIRSKKKQKPVKPTYDGKGYRCAKLSKKGKRYYLLVHRLVALCFIPNPYGYDIVNHKDGDVTNCRADNLEWCDNSYNVRYHNVVKNSYGRATDKKNSTSMTTSKALLLMNEDEIPVDVFTSLADAGRRYEASQNSIRRSARSHKPTKKGEQFFFVDDFLKRLYVREGYIIELYEE